MITLVVARAINGVIGLEGGLPWHLPADLKHFKRITMDTAMVMGRRTFESLPGLLPGRRHIVLTRDIDWKRPGAELAYGVEGVHALAAGQPISVIGGAEIFELFIDQAERIELTEVERAMAGDTLMPDPRTRGNWRETARETFPESGDQPGFSFITLVRS